MARKSRLQVTEIRADYSATINLGNYENMKLSAGLTVTCPVSEDPEAVYKEAQELCRQMVEEQAEAANQAADDSF